MAQEKMAVKGIYACQAGRAAAACQGHGTLMPDGY
jgi:hypothetical protein